MMIKYFMIIFICLVSFAHSQTIPNLPEPRCSGAAEAVNDTLYFFGGANRHYLGSTRYQTVYKLEGNSWIVVDSIPDDNTLGMGSAVVGNDVYLFGGYRFGNRVVRKYNVTNKTWAYLNQSPNFSTFGSTFEYVNDHIYAFLADGKVYEYDLSNDNWIEKTQNNFPGYSLTSEVYQNEVYVLGFYDTTFSHPFYKYSPISNTWTKLADLPYQVVKCAMEVIGDKIYCAGGSYQGSASNQFDALLVYDIISDSWTIDSFKLSSKRVWMSDIIYEEKFYVLGGIDSTGFAVNIVEQITPLGTVSTLSEIEHKQKDYKLYQNYPNPFNPNTKISWQSPVSSHQTLKVYDVLGNEVAVLVDEFKSVGSYEIDFNASALPSGVYFYKLVVGNNIQAKKMILLR